MPAAMKVFSGKTPDAQPTHPFTITLENKTGETKDQVYEAYTDPPAHALVIIGRMMRVNDKGEQFLDSSLLAEALEGVIVAGDRERWKAEVMADGTGWDVPASMLADIFIWLQTTVFERPTVPSSGSSDTPSGTGAGSTANVPSVASTSPAS